MFPRLGALIIRSERENTIRLGLYLNRYYLKLRENKRSGREHLTPDFSNVRRISCFADNTPIQISFYTFNWRTGRLEACSNVCECEAMRERLPGIIWSWKAKDGEVLSDYVEFQDDMRSLWNFGLFALIMDFVLKIEAGKSSCAQIWKYLLDIRYGTLRTQRLSGTAPACIILLSGIIILK
jgi:hypothetical protein